MERWTAAGWAVAFGGAFFGADFEAKDFAPAPETGVLDFCLALAGGDFPETVFVGADLADAVFVDAVFVGAVLADGVAGADVAEGLLGAAFLSVAD
jgi:uncharacterized protein YjbI with pentapeptide repeats